MGRSTSTDTWIIIWTIARAITVASLHAESVRLSTVLSSTATQCMTLMATRHRAATDKPPGPAIPGIADRQSVYRSTRKTWLASHTFAPTRKPISVGMCEISQRAAGLQVVRGTVRG